MSTAELVDLWQHGLGRPSLERGLALASVTAPTGASDCLGIRNQRILEMRRRHFGAQVDSVAQCPLCATYVEASFLPNARTSDEAAGVHSMRVAEFEITFRLPNSLDLAYLLRFEDEEEAERALVARCVSSVRRKGAELSATDLTGEAVEALSARMEELDPCACQTVHLECPNCSHRWSCLFEVAGYVWREVSTSARRALLDVHELAKAYGWTEADVFALPAARRQMYLEMVRA